MSKRAFLFPGQGAQYVGMAKDLFANSESAREMISQADDILGYKLSEIMFNGPEDELKQTKNTQPAIFLHSVVLQSLVKSIDFDAAAGHSLGEYSALVALGALSFEDALKLVSFRGQAMQQSGVDNPGTMAAILGLAPEKIAQACIDASAEGIVQPANFNCPGQVVISGSVSGVRKGMELCKLSGAKLVKELVVSGAFHSPLMQSAKDKMEGELAKTNILSISKPVYANVTASAVNNNDEIRKLLFQQVTSPVLWEQTIHNLFSDGFTEFVEIGPGKVLQGLVKKIAPAAVCMGIDTYNDLEKYL